MCVRYTLHRPEAAIGQVARALGQGWPNAISQEPRYNIALNQEVPVVALKQGAPALGTMRWGFRRTSSTTLLGNAKAETARQLPTFAEATGRRRCLLPANGYYEWQTRGGQKWPFLFSLRDEEPFAFAGLWQPPSPGELASCCFLTTAPNAVAATVHTRMPVLLRGAALALWLQPQALPEADWATLVAPLDPELLQLRPVDRYVSSVRHEGPACHAAPKPGDEQTELF